MRKVAATLLAVLLAASPVMAQTADRSVPQPSSPSTPLSAPSLRHRSSAAPSSPALSSTGVIADPAAHAPFLILPPLSSSATLPELTSRLELPEAPTPASPRLSPQCPCYPPPYYPPYPSPYRSTPGAGTVFAVIGVALLLSLAIAAGVH